jgi:glycosyltransferase involved in cell wall biosynthesis
LKKRVVVSVNNNLAFDQRVEKFCHTLYFNDCDVFLIGTTLRGKPKLNRAYSTYRIPQFFQSSFLLYAEINLKLFFYLLFKTKSSDILLVNDLDILLPNYLISVLKKNKIIFDSHEYFSELPSVQGKFSQQVWKFLEKIILPKLDKICTVSEGIQKIYIESYNKSTVLIKNLPISYEIQPNNKKFHHKKFIIYQGAINPYRGIDKLILAMKNIKDVDVLIFGNGTELDEYKSLTKKINLENQIYFFGNIPPSELREITSQAEFGISIEENAGLSYYYSLPNKLFDYIQAEIPVLGTYLPENKYIIEKYQVGTFIENHSIEEITDKINYLLNVDKTSFINNLKVAKKELCWENQEEKLIDWFNS